MVFSLVSGHKEMVKSRLLRLVALLLLKRLAVWYWKKSVIDRIESIVATQRYDKKGRE